MLWNTSANVRCFPSLKSTTSYDNLAYATKKIGENWKTDIRALLHLVFDKTQKMLLIHASRMMNVSINFSDIIEISMWYPLIIEKNYILVSVKMAIQSGITHL